MKSQCSQQLLTFVQSGQRLSLVILFLSALLPARSGWCAPYTEAPAERAEEQDLTKPPSGEKKENFSVTKPPGGLVSDTAADKQFDPKIYYYPYKKEIDVHAGVVLGLKDSSDDSKLVNGLVGFSYVLPKRLSPKWEVGADLSTVGNGHLWVQQRHIFNEKSSYRPYYEYGVMHNLDPDDKLASFSNWDNYLARGGIGFAMIDYPPRSYQVEIEAAVGKEDILVMATVGYAWGF